MITQASKGVSGSRLARDKPRKGAITAIVLVCLVVLMSISGVILRLRLLEHKRLKQEENRLQAEWLAESAVSRALARLKKSNGAYQGEVWKLSRDDWMQPEPGQVEIKVERVPSASGKKRVQVVADYPPTSPNRIRLSKSVTVSFEENGARETQP